MSQARTRRIERALGDAMRARLPPALAEFVMFTLKQGWASLFGAMITAPAAFQLAKNLI